MEAIEFINSIKDVAIEVQNKYKIFASISISQAILESGWGTSTLAQKYCNLYGIKALRNWTGKVANVDTREWTKDEIVTINQPFRVYSSWTESILDHAKFLQKEWYIEAGVFKARNFKKQIEAIFNGGYTSDPNYITKIIELIDKYNLKKYDDMKGNDNMIIGIDMGHPLTGGGTGAVGIRNETDCNREVGKKVIAKLKALGHTVINCTTDYAKTQAQSLQDRVDLANKQYLDLFVSIHFNCGGGHGTEVYTWGGKEFTQSRNILNNIANLGYRNRGIKDGSNLFVIRHSKAKAMLIECSFIDSNEDMDRYNAEDLSNAIVKGLVGQTIKAKTETKAKYTVQYCLEFQKWYNATTKTRAPLVEDGLYGPATEKALQTILNIVREF
ncbi:glucosaminidase domain-containing protein [Clostridium botulinum]|uniref:glucosaminidase domain-containing protein n=1 Tax=Clostridium botulinum TaxID=1491 RepID=UPI0004D680AD|nr:glucosaminidase domain-containing protein [Clostridium botulinum]KEH96194.1 peptidoglycan hydrolase [Clostridium botulinum D str. 16868]